MCIRDMPSTTLSTASSRKIFQLGYPHRRSSRAFWMRPRLSKMTVSYTHLVAQKTDLGTLMQEHSAGDTLSITVARDGQMQTVSLTRCV